MSEAVVVDMPPAPTHISREDYLVAIRLCEQVLAAHKATKLGGARGAAAYLGQLRKVLL